MAKLRLIGLTLILAASMCLFGVACSGGAKGSDEPIAVTIWHVYGAQTDSPLNDLIDEFNNTVGKEEGIRVDVTMVSNNNNIHDSILAAANGEPGAADLPDIFVAYPKTVLAMSDDEILVDYADYFSEEELSAFVPEFLEDGTINDRLVILPVAKSTELLFVDQTLLERFSAETGVQVSDLKTWEGLYEASRIYAEWTDQKTPDVPNDGKAFFVHDFHFNYLQVGVESLGGSFFDGQKIAFDEDFERAWRPYAEAAISGGMWLGGGYATEPLRTGEAVASVASSASVLYFSEEVIYEDNTTENIKFTILPCPTFEDGEKLVMQRGAGMCLVKSTPERERAATTFLKWLTEAECNTRFATSAGYMPVASEAYNSYLPQAIEKLEEQKYVELYSAFGQTQEGYSFYSAPQLDSYLEMEDRFEDDVRACLADARSQYLAAGGNDEALLAKLVQESLDQIKAAYA
ncbi:MAG: extracellular solute-binding protein [Eggerthellaceae bacterium]|nr:extracellular solute-binding protein [Eggerthellaceae bacterium]